MDNENQAENKKDTDLIAVADRMKNNCRFGKFGYRELMPAGEVMCNTTAHFLVSLYQFAELLPQQERATLYNLVKKGEMIPASIIDICNPHRPENEE